MIAKRQKILRMLEHCLLIVVVKIPTYYQPRSDGRTVNRIHTK